MKRIITADSSANLYHDDFPDFVPVPLKIVTDSKEYVDDERLDVAAMLRELRAYKGRSGTSCPSAADWLSAFGDADEVFGASLTSHLSGCYNAAQLAAADYASEHPNRRVFIMDSLTTGPELELIVERYGELIRSGRTFEQICSEITEYLKHTRLMFSLESLSNFAKNGRVSPLLAKAVDILGIRIVGRASAEGELEPMHKCRGEKTALQKLVNGMLEEGYAGGRVRIRHSENPTMAVRLVEELRKAFPNADITVGANRGLCSYYAERGGILVGFEIK